MQILLICYRIAMHVFLTRSSFYIKSNLDKVMSEVGTERDNAAKKLLLAAGNIDYSTATIQMLYLK